MSTPAPQERPQHPLRNGKFRRLWIGTGISFLGDQFYLVALPWLILQLTGSSIVLGSIMMTAAIPRAVLMLIGGAVTDRVSARRIMMTTASTRCVLVAAIAALLWAQRLHLWQMYALAGGFGVADAFAAPASQTLLPSLIGAEQLPAANSVMQSTAQITTLVAPAPAGILVKALGTAWAFLIDAVSFLFIIGALWKLPDPPLSPARRGMWHSIVEGVRYVRGDVALWSLLLVASVLNFCISGPMSVGMAYLAKQRYGSPTAFGVLMSALAAGSLAGVLAAGLRKQRKRGLVLLGTCTVIGCCIATIPLLAALWALAALLALMAASAGFVNVQLVSWFQQRVERAVMGRVMSVVMFSAIGLLPISLAVAGFALQWNPSGMFVTAGALVIVVTAMAALHRPVREID